MRRTAALSVLAATVTFALLAPTPATAGGRGDDRGPQHVVQPTLVARATLSADFLAPGPPSGALATAANGRQGPFAGQVIPGFSGMVEAGDGTFWALPDNGFGTKANSADFLLRLYRVTPDWQTAARRCRQIGVGEFLSLRDPDHRIDFPIVNETTPDRLLTGADFDVESVVRAPGRQLLDRRGVRAVPAARRPEREAARGARAVRRREVAAEPVPQPGETPNVRASRGFEALAGSRDGRFLYPITEGAFVDDPDQRRRTIYEFDTPPAPTRAAPGPTRRTRTPTSSATRSSRQARAARHRARRLPGPGLGDEARVPGRPLLGRRRGLRAQDAGPRRAEDREPRPPRLRRRLRHGRPVLAARAVVRDGGAAARRPAPARQRQQLPGQRRARGGHAGRHGDGRRRPASVRAAEARRGHRHRAPRRQRLPPRAHAGVATRRRSCSAPTTSSPTSSRPRTACWSPGTRTRSAAPPTSPTTPSSPPAATTKIIDGARRHRLVHRGLHARRAEDAARQGAPARRAARRTPRSTARYAIPTFDEVLDLARHSRTCDGRPVGVYPRPSTPRTSTRSGSRSRSRCWPRSTANGLNDRGAPVIIQSFETGNLRAARTG